MTRRRLNERQQERIQHAQDRRRRRASERAETALETGALGPEQTGLVIANYGATLIVEAPDGSLHRCAVRQHLGAVVCGDRVVWQAEGADAGVVSALLERRSLLTRPDFSGRPRPVAANLDQITVVAAPRPELNEALIDRYLVAATLTGLEPLLLVNKVDLLDTAALAALDRRLQTYRQIGYAVLYASTRSEHGLAALRTRLQKRASILAGQSGVGKSSLIKALLPDLDIRIHALSDATGLGTHTTSTTMLYHLPGGGDLIDSPGVRGFDLGEVSVAELESGFVEFAPYLGRCRFSDCGHTVEPGCALLAAVAAGAIDPRRLASYQQIRLALPPPMF